MALQFVGGNTGTWAGATTGTNNVSLTGLTGGIASSAAIGDIVIAVYATGSTADRTLSITDGTTAYTLIDSELYANGTSYDTNFRVAYKMLTAADANTVFGATGNNADAGAAAVYVWRNEDSTTPLDVAAIPATGTGTGQPNAGAIQPTTAGTVIIVAGASAQATGATFTAGYLTAFRTVTSSDTNDVSLGIGYVNWTSGSYDPAAWTGGTTNAADSWAAMTIALRPMIKASSGVLTGQIGSVVGSAAHVAKHGTTGTLTGQLGSVSGTAQHNIPHPTSGTLTGQLGSVSGSATRFRTYSTSGTLTGQLGSISGNARLNIPHSTSGVLPGQTAIITGDADREDAALPHISEGVLTGQGSVVTGDADRESRDVSHISSGSLVGQGAKVVGSAERTGSKQEIAGGTSRPQRKSRLIIVEVDGKEYRLTEAQLPSFLEQVRVEAEQQAKTQEKPVKRNRKGKKAKVDPTPVEEAPVIVVKQAPPDIVPKINAQIEQTNTVIANAFAISLQKYLQELEDEEIILMLM